MSKSYGLEIGDLDMIDEAFFGPPPRFLVEGLGNSREADDATDRLEGASFFPGISKIKTLMGAW
jgi:hypothetical protein